MTVPDIRTILGNRVSVTLPKQAMPLIDILLKTQLWGSTKAEVTRNLVLDQLKHLHPFWPKHGDEEK